MTKPSDGTFVTRESSSGQPSGDETAIVYIPSVCLLVIKTNARWKMPWRGRVSGTSFGDRFGVDPKFETLRNRDNCSERRFGWQPVFSKWSSALR